MIIDTQRVKRGNLKGVDTIEIVGPFDFNDSTVIELVEQLIAEGKTNLIFNLEKTSYLTSPGIACIIRVVKKARAAGVSRVGVYGATADMVELLTLARLSEYIAFL